MPEADLQTESSSPIDRRRFVQGGAAAVAAMFVADRAAAAVGASPVSPSTAGLIATSLASGVVETISVVTVSTYAELRAYSGTAKYFIVTGASGAMLPETFGEFYVDAADTTSSDNGGTIIVLANGARAKRRFTGDVNVEWFGAVGNGESPSPTNCDAAFANALAYCHTTGRSLYIPRRSYYLTQTLTIDLSRTTIHGDGARLIFTSRTSGNAIKVYSTEGYPASNVTDVWLGGFTLVGAMGQTGTTGFFVGDPGYSFPRQLEFRHVSVFRFGKNYEFGEYSYRIRFSHCTSAEPNQYHAYSPLGLLSAGEANSFDHCLFENGGEILLYDGQWAFRSCSFLNMKFRAAGQAHVTIFGGNIESPGGATGNGYRYVSVEDTAFVDLKGPTIIIATPQGGTFNMAPIVNASTGGGGLMLDGVLIPQEGFMHPETTDAVRTFVAGAGRTIISGAHVYESFGQRDFFPIARACNVIANHNAESGNTNGWTTSTSGSGGTFTAIAGGKTGTRGFRIAGASGGGIKAYQEFPTIPGRVVMVGLWARVLSWGGYVALEYYNQQGLLVQRTQQNITNASPPNGSTTGSWTWAGGLASAIAPPGATKGRFLVEATGDNVIEFDDVIVNVV